MKTATLIEKLTGFVGDARHYRLSEPLEAHEGDKHTDVIVSAVTLPLWLGTETYIFPATDNGKIASWGELPGSLKNTLSHAEALAAAGYEVV